MKNEIQNLTYCEDTLKLKRNIEAGFVDLGRRLMEIRNRRLYIPQWTSFPEYLEEMALSESQASKLINIFSKLVVGYGFSTERLLETKGWAVLSEGLPFIKTKEDAEELVHLATVLSSSDVRKHYKELKTGIDMRDCKHENYYVIKVCRECGDKQLIEDSKHDQIN